MKDSLRTLAADLGFAVCRFTTVEPPATGKALAQWIEHGHHGEMGWIARNLEKRLNPGLILPEARTLVCLAVSYGAAPEPTRKTAPSGLQASVARYARHQDYHEVLAKPLQLMAAHLNALGGAGTRSLWYVDTGPILERDLAQRAGVGFVGKHTNLIHRRLGNWLLLAEILTTLSIPPDDPEQNRCGKCTRCLDACPTQAFVGPFQLDARRCISYLTIENKGPIPEEFRAAIGGHVFGCDDCLEVCPWNRWAHTSRLMQSVARPELDQPALLEWLQLDEAGFRRTFAGTPLLRSKRRGLLRNVCVVLGNVGDLTALPQLRQAAQDPEPLIAEHAAWAIRHIERRTASPAGPITPPSSATDGRTSA